MEAGVGPVLHFCVEAAATRLNDAVQVIAQLNREHRRNVDHSLSCHSKRRCSSAEGDAIEWCVPHVELRGVLTVPVRATRG